MAHQKIQVRGYAANLFSCLFWSTPKTGASPYNAQQIRSRSVGTVLGRPPDRKNMGLRLPTFSTARPCASIKNCSTGHAFLFIGQKINAAQVGMPALLGMPIFLSRHYAPVFEVKPRFVPPLR